MDEEIMNGPRISDFRSKENAEINKFHIAFAADL